MVECLNSQAEQTCLPQSWVCEGHFECLARNADTCLFVDVPLSMCSETKFWCHLNETCLPDAKVCDGHRDCDGAEDEMCCAGIFNHALLK